MNQIILGDCATVLPTLPSRFARLAYVDPPFNTGKVQTRQLSSYTDSFTDFESFLMPRIQAGLRCLTDDGSIMIHLDYREVHYIKVAMDQLLGRDHFINEIVWSYDYGARSKKRYSTKHDTILWYCKDPANYVFHYDQLQRIPYMAPALQTPERQVRGKTVTDVIWQTIVPTMSKENLRYPTQKPLGLINQFIRVHTDPGDTVLDFFAGSGTVGAAAKEQGRNFVMIDQNPDAVALMNRRLQPGDWSDNRVA